MIYINTLSISLTEMTQPIPEVVISIKLSENEWNLGTIKTTLLPAYEELGTKTVLQENEILLRFEYQYLQGDANLDEH